ncbi:MAG TPA: type II toxin-antitoxin system HicB family antitoxin [Candidatus Wunengus sp. YC63]|uniref:type II toxin-antitoxin system HicB family antitoxin n=1 Tax=unclassified Candidatus Wunengus TaxID=3367695 RepID=UPI004029D547
MVSIEFDVIVFKEGQVFIAYCPELDVSSCGNTIEQSRENLKTAVRLFLEEAEKMGTLEDILIEAGYKRDKADRWQPPRIVATEVMGIG